MARHAEESRDDLQNVKSLNVFYQVGLTFRTRWAGCLYKVNV